MSFILGLAGIIVAGGAEGVSSWLFPDPMELSTSEAYLEWGTRIIRDIGWMGAATVLLVSGIWLIRRAGVQLGSLGRLVLGVFGFLVPMGAALMFVHTMSKFELSEAMVAEKLAEAAKAAMSNESMEIEKRAMVSRIYARDVWYKTGDRIKHIGPEGSVVTFVPTERELERQQEARRVADLLKWTTVRMKRTGVISTALLVACIATGLMLPVPKQDDG